MTKLKKFIFFILPLAMIFSFSACSSGDDGGNGNENEKGTQQTSTVTVTYYGDTTSTTPRTVSLESGSTLSEKLAVAPEGYTFQKWIDASGTDYTGNAITGDVTLFAYFVKTSSSSEGSVTTTTTSEKSVETDKTTVEKKNSASGTTVTKVSESTTKLDGTKIESESTKTENADGSSSETAKTTVTNADNSKTVTESESETTAENVTTSKETVTETDTTGNTTKTETSVAADGTTTKKTTDSEGKTEITVTDKDGNEKEIININEILLNNLQAASTATTFKPSATAPAEGTETFTIVEDVNAVAWLDGTTIYYYAKGYTDSGKGIPLGLGAAGMFKECSSLKSIDMTGFDTSECTDMELMFNRCSELILVDLSKMDTSNVTNMHAMFNLCEKLESIDVSKFDTSKVTRADSMFGRCRAVTSLDVSHFDTSNITNIAGMFYECNALESVDVSNFNTSKATDMNRMFQGCKKLTQLDVSNFDTSNVTSMLRMFNDCNALETLDVSHFKTSKVTNMSFMLKGLKLVTKLDVSNFDTSNVTDMGGMFKNCRSLVSIDVSHFNTSKVTTTAGFINGSDGSTYKQGMFEDCRSLTSLDLSNFDTSNITDMTNMFKECYALSSLNVSSFDTSNVTEMGGMFYKCSSLTSLDLSNFDISKLEKTNSQKLDANGEIIDRWGMFGNSAALTTIYVPTNSDWNVSSVLTESTGMFDRCPSLVGGNGTTYDSTHTDKSYARIDGGTSKPGYFTAKASSGNTPTPTPSPSSTGLPTSVGTNEFSGKTWTSSHGDLVFTADTLTEDDEICRYSYDSQNKLLYTVLVSKSGITSVDEYIAYEKAETEAQGGTYTSGMEAYARAKVQAELDIVNADKYEISGNTLTLKNCYFTGLLPTHASFHNQDASSDYSISLGDKISITDETTGTKYHIYPTYSGGTSGTFTGTLFTKTDKVAVGEIEGTYATSGTGFSGCTVTLRFTKIPSALSAVTTGKDYLLQQESDYYSTNTYTLK